ncbi:hypothetical protein M5689_001885 [Euphorbia peplus]|nr:hypothetical protein M5689_001885 [Euphorbia peplus]
MQPSYVCFRNEAVVSFAKKYLTRQYNSEFREWKNLRECFGKHPVYRKQQEFETQSESILQSEASAIQTLFATTIFMYR